MDLLDRKIYDTDPNENYEVLEQTLKEVHTELCDLMIRNTSELHGKLLNKS